MKPASLHTALTQMLARNAGARVDRIRRIALDHCDHQARKLLRAIEEDMRSPCPRGRLSMLSIYGGEAAVMDLVKQSATHRERGKIAEAA